MPPTLIERNRLGKGEFIALMFEDKHDEGPSWAAAFLKTNVSKVLLSSLGQFDSKLTVISGGR